MTSKRISAVLLTGLILASLAGCAVTEQPTATAGVNSAQSSVTDGAEDNKIIDDTPAEPADPTASVSGDKTAPETQLPTEKEDSQPESSSPPAVQTEAPKPAETKPVQTNPPKKNEPGSTEPVQPPKTETPKPAPTEPPATETSQPDPPKPTEPAKPVYTQADYDRIIREATEYAESYQAKGFTFEWKESMQFGWEVGYMGTPRIEAEGVEGTISRLKTHIDKIVETSTNPAYGITTDIMTYKVVQITIDGDIAFAVIYGG